MREIRLVLVLFAAACSMPATSAAEGQAFTVLSPDGTQVRLNVEHAPVSWGMCGQQRCPPPWCPWPPTATDDQLTDYCHTVYGAVRKDKETYDAQSNPNPDTSKAVVVNNGSASAPLPIDFYESFNLSDDARGQGWRGDGGWAHELASIGRALCGTGQPIADFPSDPWSTWTFTFTDGAGNVYGSATQPFMVDVGIGAEAVDDAINMATYHPQGYAALAPAALAAARNLAANTGPALHQAMAPFCADVKTLLGLQ